MRVLIALFFLPGYILAQSPPSPFSIRTEQDFLINASVQASMKRNYERSADNPIPANVLLWALDVKSKKDFKSQRYLDSLFINKSHQLRRYASQNNYDTILIILYHRQQTKSMKFSITRF